MGNIAWFTNMEHDKQHQEISLTKTYNSQDYPKYDNFDGIDVNRVKNIPCDYLGVMGVPLTFLERYNPEQFKIVGFRKGDDGKDLSINGKYPFTRILIQHAR